MKKINWDEISLHSEIEYSKALGGKVIEYENFIHIYNENVPWVGDFNRSVGIRISNFESFIKVVKKTEDIHKDKNLDIPNRYDIYPPVLNKEKWIDFLLNK